MNRISDQEMVIIAARDMFWSRGYDNTSVEDLVKATGHNRYALYSMFGGKLELFLAVLDYYQKERRDIFLQTLSDHTRPPIEAIRDVFDFCVDQMAERGVGCLLGNIAGEVARKEPLVARRIKTHFSEILDACTYALERAQERGEINEAVKPKDGAQLLVALVLGLGASVECVQSPDDARNSYRAALAALSGDALSGKTSVTSQNQSQNFDSRPSVITEETYTKK